MYIINNKKFDLYFFIIHDFLKYFYLEWSYLLKIFSKYLPLKENIFKILI